MKAMLTTIAADEIPFDFELDRQTFEEVEKLADQSGISPYQMAITLLSERIASSGEQLPPE